jgi:erythromycin esterase
LRRIIAIVTVMLLTPAAAARGGDAGAIPPWTAFGDPGAYVWGIDAAQVHDGVAPLRIAAPSGLPPNALFDPTSQGGGVGWLLDALPYRGKRVRLRGEIKTAGVTRAALWLRIDRVTNPVVDAKKPLDFIVPVKDRLVQGVLSGDALRGDHDWTPLEIVTDIPGDTLALVVGDRLAGWGTIWATYPQLEIIGPALSRTAAAVAPIGALRPTQRAAVEDALRRVAVKLRTVDPAAPLGDLAAFDRDVANARVIGLGEASPGTAEFVRMKHRLLRDLVERHGVTVVALDAGVLEARELERYVTTGQGDPADALRRLDSWEWQNDEMLALARWMRAYNAAPGTHRTLHVAGIDVQSFALAVASVRRFAGAHDAALGKTVEARYACIPRTTVGWLAQHNTRGANRACVQSVDDVARLIAPLRPDADTAHAARAVEQYGHVMMEEGTDSRGGDRGAALAENVGWLLGTRYPGAKVAVWSGNREIGSRLEAVPALAMHSRGTVGSYLARRFGAAYVSVGFAFDRGAVTARGPHGIRPTAVAASPPGTLESVLRDVGSQFYLSLRSLRSGDPAAAWLDGGTLSRDIWAFYFTETSAGLSFAVVTERGRFDTLIFVAQSHPTAAFVTARPPPGNWFPTIQGTVAAGPPRISAASSTPRR